MRIILEKTMKYWLNTVFLNTNETANNIQLDGYIGLFVYIPNDLAAFLSNRVEPN